MQTDNASTFGRYEILTELGRGAMGIVYKAYDPGINRLVAIKTISLVAADASEEQACRDRFFREAEAAGRLSHPRIVAIFDIGESPDTLTPYIVMEYVAGRSLEEVLSTGNGGLPVDTALRLTQEVAEALDYAHCVGVIHRDVKPSNIIVGEDGHAKIADFGIARLNRSDSGQAGHTWGTPGYMSPEQLRGEPVDGRSDLFSLGVILYRMLTGHRPFQGNSALTVSLKIANHEPVPATVFNTELLPELDGVIARAMAKNPAERYQTGRAMVLDLQCLRNGSTSESAGLPEEGHTSDQAANLKGVLFSPANGSNGEVLGIASSPRSREQKPDNTTEALWFSRPWQQMGIGFLSLGLLATAFVGMWRAVPIKAIPAPVNIPSNLPLQTRSAAMIGPVVPLLAANYAKVALPLDHSRSCKLGIVVEHHFVTAKLAVWVDDQPTYSHSLRGALKKRVVFFKGVEGYLSDVLQVAPGDHQIRVQVLSADGSYDESDSISGTFAPGGEKLLAIDFDKSNRRMRLSF